MFVKSCIALAALLVVVSGQANPCIRLGGPLLSSCQDALNYVQTTYPLDSTAAPTEDEIMKIIDNKPEGVPSEACCAAATSFNEQNCACDTALPTLLATVGLQTSPAGLQGIIKITGQVCNFTTAPC